MTRTFNLVYRDLHCLLMVSFSFIVTHSILSIFQGNNGTAFTRTSKRPKTRNDRLVTNDVTSGISRRFILFFCLLDDRIARPTSICLFFVEESSFPLLKQHLPKLEGSRDS